MNKETESVIRGHILLLLSERKARNLKMSRF